LRRVHRRGDAVDDVLVERVLDERRRAVDTEETLAICLVLGEEELGSTVEVEGIGPGSLMIDRDCGP